MNKKLLIAGLFAITSSPPLQAQLISTIAGDGQAGYGGDGGAATAATLKSPFNVALDDNGNIFIADRANNRVRKIDNMGIISTVAGNGTAGYNGDGNAATNALLNGPTSVAVDKKGNLYIADAANHCVRKVTPSGMIITTAGNGTGGYGGDNGPATAAQLNNPRGVAVDQSDNILVADAGNHRVRKVTADGIITTVAGNGAVGFSGDGYASTAASLHGPYYITTDHSDNLYIADVDNQRIRRVDGEGIISTVAGNGQAGYGGDGGPATAALLNEPIGIATDRSGDLYIADGWNNRVRLVDMRRGVISTIAGTGTPGFNGDDIACDTAQLNAPYGVAVDNGNNVYVADYSNNRIRKLAPPKPGTATLELTVFPNPSSGPFAIKATTGKTDKVLIAVTDLAGKSVFRLNIEPNYVTDVRTDLPAGMYFITATSADMQAHGRLIIIH
jgi:hypothetical protein